MRDMNRNAENGRSERKRECRMRKKGNDDEGKRAGKEGEMR